MPRAEDLMEKIKRKKLFYRPAGKSKGMYTPTQIICGSFVIVIALGTFLLSLPIASRHGRLDVLDAMFTATSATCVTGLIVRDTWTQFTFFGQAVILLLIQVGGLGLVTLTSFFALAMRRRMGFRDLRLLGESVSADGYAQAKDVLKIVVGLAGLFEGIGILLLLFVFVRQGIRITISDFTKHFYLIKMRYNYLYINVILSIFLISKMAETNNLITNKVIRLKSHLFVFH